MTLSATSTTGIKFAVKVSNSLTVVIIKIGRVYRQSTPYSAVITCCGANCKSIFAPCINLTFPISLSSTSDGTSRGSGSANAIKAEPILVVVSTITVAPYLLPINGPIVNTIHKPSITVVVQIIFKSGLTNHQTTPDKEERQSVEIYHS